MPAGIQVLWSKINFLAGNKQKSCVSAVLGPVFYPKHENAEPFGESSLSPCVFFMFSVLLWYNLSDKSYEDRTMSVHPLLCIINLLILQSYTTLLCDHEYINRVLIELWKLLFTSLMEDLLHIID